MSYYNQGGNGGGLYGGGGAAGSGGGSQQPDPTNSQQQQPYGYAGYNGQQQQQQQQQQQDPYTQQYQPQQQQPPPHTNLWQAQQYPQQQQQQQPQYGSYSSTPNIFGAAAPSAAPAAANYQASSSFFNPNNITAVQMAAQMAATGFAASAAGGGIGGSDAFLKMGDAAARDLWKSSTAKMVPGLESTVRTLRPYFAVDNRYVFQKMKRVAMPFAYQTWKRSVREVVPTPDHRIPPVAYHLPLHDDCAPDLYLPLMAGITYVLMSALLYGTAGKFSPEVIPDVCTKCFLTQILEVLALWLGFYALRAGHTVAVLDLFCYTGYKYQGLCLNMLVALVWSHLHISNGTRGYYLSFLYTGTAAFYFMLKTTANVIPLQLPQGTPPREMMVLAFGLSQFATMWFVGQTKFL